MPTPINKLFDHIHTIPQLPELVRQIISQLNHPNANMLDIAKNVEKDQLLALKILRLVNSAHFGLSRKVNSIQEASALIGIEKLKTLVIASGLVNTVPNIANFDIKQFWTTTFRTASYAQWLAEKAGLSKDIAYTAGLFSSLGIALLYVGAAKEANEIEQHVKAGSFRPEIEKNRIGYTNQAVCAELLHRWKLGEELITAIAKSDDPSSYQEPNKISSSVFLGNYLSNAQARNLDLETISSNLPLQVVESIGLDPEIIIANLESLLNSQNVLDGLID